jgi:hypothetical protein
MRVRLTPPRILVGVHTRVGHQVHTGTDVGSGDEFESEGVAARGYAVGSGVISAVERTVGRACRGIGAEGLVPCVTSVAGIPCKMVTQ